MNSRDADSSEARAEIQRSMDEAEQARRSQFYEEMRAEALEEYLAEKRTEGFGQHAEQEQLASASPAHVAQAQACVATSTDSDTSEGPNMKLRVGMPIHLCDRLRSKLTTVQQRDVIRAIQDALGPIEPDYVLRQYQVHEVYTDELCAIFAPAWSLAELTAQRRDAHGPAEQP